jgi:pyridoxal phosphate enzyme (YggS family)
LQHVSPHCTKLIAIPNLHILETLSSIKVADLLQKNLEHTLNVYLQVNTSGEDAKAGLPPLSSSSTASEPLAELALHVIRDCDRLNLLGLMTIGSWDASHDTSKPNPDFTSLTETSKELRRILKDEGHERDLELSMGMSADFGQAVKEGSNSVRVGTRIFGERKKH